LCFGRGWLVGEIRHVPFADKRLAEALKLGFKVAIGPRQKVGKSNKMIHEVSDIKSALNKFLKKG